MAAGLNCKDEEYQVNSLICAMGDKADDILSTLGLSTEDLKKYKAVKEAFDKYFICKYSVIYERAHFNKGSQEPGESAETFITAVYKLAEHCQYGPLQDEMIRDRLHRVLEWLQEEGLTLNNVKCKFAVNKVMFLGHIVSAQGIEADPGKLKAIREMATPKDAADVKRFVGMVNYVGKFSPHIPELTQPLQDLLKTDNEWLLMGCNIRTPLPVSREKLQLGWPDLQAFRRKDQDLKEKQAFWFDNRHNRKTRQELRLGQRVWVTNTKETGTVSGSAQTPRSYNIDLPSGNLRRNRLHIRVIPETPRETRSGRIIRPPKRLNL
ncbi:hypothetical protein ABVT39_008128 [Epinephelus coioides]